MLLERSLETQRQHSIAWPPDHPTQLVQGSYCIATLGAVDESPPEASEAAEQPDAEEANEAAEEDSGIGHIEEQLGLLNYADGEYAPIDSWHLASLSTGLSSNLLPTADTLPAS